MQKLIACSFAAASVIIGLPQSAAEAEIKSDQSISIQSSREASLASAEDTLAAEKTADIIRRSGSMAKRGKLNEAGLLWDSEVQATRGSVDWHLERAGVIMRSVFWAKENGDASTATKMAREALREVEAAERKIDNKDPAQAPALESIFELKGLLEGNFLGDTTSARREYDKRDLVRAEIAAKRQAEERKVQEEKAEGAK